MYEIEDKIDIKDMIYNVRDKQVMLDSDLAKLYHVDTKRINEAVSRNKEKFPERFCFRITEKEHDYLKSQIATSKGGARKGHTAFTEQGVTMITTILKFKIVVKTSAVIMDAFVKMYISDSLLAQKYFNGQIYGAYSKKLKMI